MSQEKTIVNVRVDQSVKDAAVSVFNRNGLSLSDAVRIFLTRTAKDNKLPMIFDRETYDAWVEIKVKEALNDDRPKIPHEEYMEKVHKRFA